MNVWCRIFSALIAGGFFSVTTDVRAETVESTIDFDGSISGICLLGTPQPGILAQNDSRTQLSTLSDGGFPGTVTARCVAVNGNLVVYTPELLSGPSDAEARRFAQISSPGLTTRSVETIFNGAESPEASEVMTIPPSQSDRTITVHMSSTRTSETMEAGDYSYRVRLILTHP